MSKKENYNLLNLQKFYRNNLYAKLKIRWHYRKRGEDLVAEFVFLCQSPVMS